MVSAKEGRPLYRYRFGRIEFDEARFELRVSGLAVDVQRKPLEMLNLLLRRAGEVVGKNEFLDLVWEGRPTVENVVGNAMAKLRAALGEGESCIVTQPRVGYRLVGTVERVAVGRDFGADLALAAGQSVPKRENFLLQSLIARTRTSEVWLARHRKTGERRVYKVCQDGEELATLKREALLYRLLSESLGRLECFVRIIDWNFESTPFFLECEYGGDDLVRWAESGNHFAAMSLDERLSLFQQLTDAVAAAHSVGVLHKDLKPSNILIAESDSGWQVRLTDFGSGRLLEPERLSKLGITELGLTQTQALRGGSLASTPLYVAPELLAGKVPTAQSDVYALGLILYQVAVGDFKRPLVSGWQRDIADPILREDISEATDGDPARRPSSAGALASRLRALEARREAYRLQEESERKSREMQLLLQRNRARRPWIVAATLALALGLIASGGLYLEARRSAQDAQSQALRADAINRFLNDHILAATDPGGPSASPNPRMLDVLRVAQEKLDLSSAVDADTKASIRLVLGRSYAALSDFAHAEQQLRKVLEEAPAGSKAKDALRLEAQYNLVEVLIDLGKHDEAGQMLQEADREAGGQVEDRSRIALAAAMGRGDYLHGVGRHQEALAAYRKAELLHDLLAREDEVELIRLRVYMADCLYFLDRMDEAVKAVSAFRTMDHPIDRYGIRYWALASIEEGRALSEEGRFEEGDRVLTDALVTLKDHMGSRDMFVLESSNELANVKLMRGRFGEARHLIEDAYVALSASQGPDSTSARIAQATRGQIELLSGEAKGAYVDLREARDVIQHRAGAAFPQLQEINLSLAEALIGLGRATEADAVIRGVDNTYPHVSGAWGPFKSRVDFAKGEILCFKGKGTEGSDLLRHSIEELQLAHSAPAILKWYRAGYDLVVPICGSAKKNISPKI